MRVTLHQYSFHHSLPSLIPPSPHRAFLTILPPTAFFIHHPAADTVSFLLCTYLFSFFPCNILSLAPAIHPAALIPPTLTLFCPSLSHPYIFECPQRHTLPALPLRYIFFPYSPALNQSTRPPSQFIHSSSTLL